MKDKYVIHFDTGRTWRGGQDQVYLLISGLKDFGIKQLLITPESSPLEGKVKNLNIAVNNIDPVNDMDIIGGIRFRKIVKQEKPDIVHFHTSKSLGIGCWALRGIKVKSVFTRRIGLPVFKNPLNCLKYRYPDSIVVISDFIKNYFVNLGFENVTKIYSTVDLERFQFKKKISENNNLNIGMIGAFDLRDKDFITFIKAADKVLTKRKDVKFVIAGEGKDIEKIRRLVNQMGKEKYIEIKGFVEDMNRLLDSLDILVHTVNFEGLGTVILQAMATGIPVVATDVGGIPEVVVNERNGYLVENKNYAMTADRILYLIENEKLRREMGERNRERVKKFFSLEKMCKDYFKIYNSL